MTFQKKNRTKNNENLKSVNDFNTSNHTKDILKDQSNLNEILNISDNLITSTNSRNNYEGRCEVNIIIRMFKNNKLLNNLN